MADYLAGDDPALPRLAKKKRRRSSYYRIDVDAAKEAHSLGGNCLWIYMNIVKRSNQLRRFGDWIWIDSAFTGSVQLCQRTVRRCVHKLALSGLVGVTSVKGRFVKVCILEAEEGKGD